MEPVGHAPAPVEPTSAVAAAVAVAVWDRGEVVEAMISVWEPVK